MSHHAESSTAATAHTSFSRNDDPLTVALRTGTPLSLDDLVHLNRADVVSRDVPSTLGTLTTSEFSSRKESDLTKPTSAGTSYITGYAGKGKGQVVATYASSLSATHGSGSEAEAEQGNFLLGVGDQFMNNPLKGAARARKRPGLDRISKPKKLPPIIHHEPLIQVSSEDDIGLVVSSRRHSKETKYFRRRQSKRLDDRLVLADEERISPVEESNPAGRFSRARVNVIIGLCVVIALTFAFSAFAAHHTGKGRLACTKGIIFSATVVISVCTVLVMTLARRALQEALLAGLLEFVVGFALVIEIRDFMEHAP